MHQLGRSALLINSNGAGNAQINHLPLLHTTIDVLHLSNQQSAISNTGEKSFKWKAIFYGTYKQAYANGNLIAVRKGADPQQRKITIVETTVKPGQKVNIKVEY
jgi:hypothetical protein